MKTRRMPNMKKVKFAFYLLMLIVGLVLYAKHVGYAALPVVVAVTGLLITLPEVVMRKANLSLPVKNAFTFLMFAISFLAAVYFVNSSLVSRDVGLILAGLFMIAVFIYYSSLFLGKKKRQ